VSAIGFKNIPGRGHQRGEGLERMKAGVQSVQNESHKFASDVIWYAVSQLFVSLILGVVTLPALTKSYAPAIYGIWVQVNVTVDFISPLLSMQLGLGAVRFLAGEEDREKRRRAVGAMLSAITVVLLAASVVGLVFAKPLSAFLFNSSEYTIYVDFLILWVFFNSVFNFLLSYLRARSRIKEISIIQIVITAMKVGAILVLALRALDIAWIFTAMVGLQVLVTLGTLAVVVREIGFPLPNTRGLQAFLVYSFPQTPVIMLLWAIGLSDRYFITKFLGLSQTAVYSSSAMLAALISLFYFPVSFVLLPQVSMLRKQNREAEVKTYFESSMRLFLTLAIPAAVGLAVLSQPLLKILTTSDFLAGREIVFLLALGAVFLGIYQITITLILVDSRAKWLPVVTAAAYATSLGMNIALVPHIGIMGAAISNCAAFFVVAALTTIWARMTVAYAFNFGYYGKVAVSTAAMLLSLILLRVDSFGSLVLAAAIGSAVFVAALVISRAFSFRDAQLVGKTLSNMLSRKQA
jgi:O-antigen/teichoic acid export membrane protein